MFSWFRNNRRRRWMEEAVPASWGAILSRQAPFVSQLTSDERDQLHNTMKVLIAEKHWEGCSGLPVTLEMQVTIAAHASRLTLGLADKYFDQVQTVLIHPDSYTFPTRTALSSGFVIEGESELAGQAWQRGPVILSWKDVQREVHGRRSGHNVVLHEFAHQLDMQNGAADGVPVIESAAEAQRWQRTVDRHFEWLCSACRQGEDSVLDCYGTTNKAEFFAVATEAFFEVADELQESLPELYALLRDFYQQDPAKVAAVG